MYLCEGMDTTPSEVRGKLSRVGLSPATLWTQESDSRGQACKELPSSCPKFPLIQPHTGFYPVMVWKQMFPAGSCS